MTLILLTFIKIRCQATNFALARKRCGAGVKNRRVEPAREEDSNVEQWGL